MGRAAPERRPEAAVRAAGGVRRLSLDSEIGRTLTASVRADPSDGPGWLVLADWLTEHGDVRGELIVLEHRLAAAKLSVKERLELRKRIRALKDAHEAEWRAALELPERVSPEWRHSFVDGVKVRRWSHREIGVLDRLFASPEAWLLTRLDVSRNSLALAGARALAASENLRNLASLDLGRNRVNAACASVLASSETLRNLVELALYGNYLGTEGASALASSETLRNLASLDLAGNYLDDEGARALAESEALRNLTRLDVRANRISVLGARAILASEGLPNLTELDLGGNDLDAEDVRVLAASGALRGCRVRA